jgi:hypothetical protein
VIIPTTVLSTAATFLAGGWTSEDASGAAAGVDPAAIVEVLASDALQGRNNATPESAAARDALIGLLSPHAAPWNPAAGDTDGYFQEFAEGVNVIGIVPGTDLADEYVMVGAHYDHLAPGDCRFVTADDEICNGAVDNATGTAAAVSVAAALAAQAPRRSVIIALWDAEEDGHFGSRAFVESPVVPLDQIVTYVNFDMQGSRLLPSLADDTFVIGAETGGTALVDLVAEVTAASSLRYASVSLIIGQGQSDHAELAAAGVPVVFFTDSTNGCYHSVDDEIAVVDVEKLGEQIDTATQLVQRLADDDHRVEFAVDAPTTSFTDAERLLDLARAGQEDLAGTDPATVVVVANAIAAFEAVVDAGPDAYDAAAQGSVLGAAAQLVAILPDLDCAAIGESERSVQRRRSRGRAANQRFV